MFGVEPAHNLLPSWRAVLKSPAPKVALPTQLTLALYNYTALQTCAQAIARLLAAQGITLSIHTYTYRELNQRALKGELDETLVLTNINLDDNRHASAFAMLFSNPILHACASQDEVIWLMQQLNAVREQAQLPQYLDQLEPIASLLVSESCWRLFSTIDKPCVSTVYYMMLRSPTGVGRIFAMCGRRTSSPNDLPKTTKPTYHGWL